MLVIKCDRCGHVLGRYESSQLWIKRRDTNEYSEEVDLCKECTEAVAKWIHQYTEDEKE